VGAADAARGHPSNSFTGRRTATSDIEAVVEHAPSGLRRVVDDHNLNCT
jgi:hypothetical protein